MKEVYAVLITTESGDDYLEVYDHMPRREDIVLKLWEDEGRQETLDWYLDTTQVRIDRTYLRTKK